MYRIFFIKSVVENRKSGRWFLFSFTVNCVFSFISLSLCWPVLFLPLPLLLYFSVSICTTIITINSSLVLLLLFVVVIVLLLLFLLSLLLLFLLLLLRFLLLLLLLVFLLLLRMLLLLFLLDLVLVLLLLLILFLLPLLPLLLFLLLLLLLLQVYKVKLQTSISYQNLHLDNPTTNTFIHNDFFLLKTLYCIVNLLYCRLYRQVCTTLLRPSSRRLHQLDFFFWKL